MIHARLEAVSKDTALLHCANERFPAVIGAAGIVVHKSEGDHATPLGLLPLRRVLYRADRIARPITSLKLEPIAPNDGWCDDVSHPDYNQHVNLPHPARHEKLWREDHVYDLLVVLGYNDAPIERGRGSAIFMHLTSPDRKPTEGCIALSESDLRRVLALDVVSIEVLAPV